MLFSILHRLSELSLFGHPRARCLSSRPMRQRVREINSLMLSRPSTRYGFPPLVRAVTGL